VTSSLVSHNLDRLFDLQKYPFTALEIASSVDEEQVADIFVRINSEGVKLNQADFILTLLSVFWDKGRAELESFCRASRAASFTTHAVSLIGRPASLVANWPRLGTSRWGRSLSKASKTAKTSSLDG
jgi:hypothetical protein